MMIKNVGIQIQYVLKQVNGLIYFYVQQKKIPQNVELFMNYGGNYSFIMMEMSYYKNIVCQNMKHVKQELEKIKKDN